MSGNDGSPAGGDDQAATPHAADGDAGAVDGGTHAAEVEVIDAFAHVLPEDFLERMREAHPSDELAAMDDDRFWDVDRRLADMDAVGIDRQVLTLGRASLWQGLDPDEALPLIRAANDAVAAYAEQSDRFVGVGTLPFLTGAYLDELDRCVDDLGMAGVQIFSNVEGRPLDAEEHEPFFERVDRREVTLWLHPQLHEWHEWDDQHMLHKIFGWPFDTGLALARLACTGVLERHDLDIVAHHAGGVIPHFDVRFEDMYEGVLDSPEVFPYETVDLPEPPLSYLREINGDSVLGGSNHAMQCAYDFYGDRMVFGTDYPFGPEEGRRWPRSTIQAVEALDVSDAERERVYAGTIRELLDC